MFHWRLPQAACVLSVCLSLALAYEDDFNIKFSDPYYNDITEDTIQATTPPAPCTSRDLNKWDKLFSMLENSQMRENMLLQYADDIIQVELGSLRSDMMRFLDQYGGTCGVEVENAGKKMVSQMEDHLRELLERHKVSDPTSALAAGDSGPVATSRSFSIGSSVPSASGTVGPAGGDGSDHLETILQQLLTMANTQASKLTKMASCLSNPRARMGRSGKAEHQHISDTGAGNHQQEVTSQDLALEGLMDAIQGLRRMMKETTLPAGYDMALHFPMRSRRIYTEVIPVVPLSLSSFTVCMWVKPTAISNKTVLFSYGTRRNPYEIQLLLGQASARFTVGGEAHLVEAENVVNPGQWMHLCGSWSSKQGMATLWVGGKKVASIPGVAEGHTLPAGGSLQLGQEKYGCCIPSSGGESGVKGFESSFDLRLAFAGKLTGVNMWDKVLSEEDIFKVSQSSELTGNVVAWGVTEMVPHGGAQFTY
ncbi:pentraxin-related protein PTX3 isoform X2 [Gouania willdenowi]|uniref:pentraxin-related protein PTX3 isoform X2 n=1 Tax=Gouania willdenowi TaxID=441366 RepID=UPI0010541CCB|nr:pentraxin-related protein PTX3 isoform X2 [Gouania willdenowi]